MRFRIHFEHSDATEDSFIVVGKDVESIRILVDSQLAHRGADVSTAWSEPLEEKP